MLDGIVSFLTTMFYIGSIILLIVLAVLYFFQNKILYLPEVQGLAKSPANNPVGYRNPGDMGIQYKNVVIKTDDNVVIRGWLCLNQDSQKIPTIVYFHENAGNIGTRVFYVKEYMKQSRVNILLVAYRGFSDSDGVPTEIGLQFDSKATMKYILKSDDIDINQVFIHGRSLGGAVATYVTHEQNLKIAGLILEITFTSLGDMVDVIFPKISMFKGLLREIKSIKKSITLKRYIYAMKDELVPPAHLDRLYETAQNATFKEKHYVLNGNHNNNWQLDPDAYFKSVNGFIQKALNHKK